MPEPDSPQPDPSDPFGLGKLFGGDIMGQLQRLLSWTGGPVNWDLAMEVARSAVAPDDPAPDRGEGDAVTDACRLADLWLDAATDLPAAQGTAHAWSRADWLDGTLPAWKALVEPVAVRVTAALGTGLEATLTGENAPPELAGMLSGPNPFAAMMNQVGGLVFGAQVGQALGALAGEVLSATEVGLPLGPCALLPANVTAFADGLEVPFEEVRLYVALREAAHQRLFAHVPWLRAHLFGIIDAYARGIQVDPDALQRAVGELDLTDPSRAQEALAGGLLDPQPSPAQRADLDRLETALALVEGWVDHVVDAAASGRLPHAAQLRETVRRRRATGGPAEQTFAALVGLQLRPRRSREAAALWAFITDRVGTESRDALWAHPDLVPGAAALDDPLGWQEPTAAAAGQDADWDAALRQLDKDLDGELDDDARGPDDGEPNSP